MKNKHLFLSPELLSRLTFTQPEPGVYFVQGRAGDQAKRALPEEIIRQLVVLSLVHQYGYPQNQIRLEHPIQMGRTKKRADIAVLTPTGEVHIVIEAKQRVDEDCLAQLRSYAIVAGAEYGLAISATDFQCLKREGSNRFARLDDLPVFGGGGSTDVPPAISASPIENLRRALKIDAFERVDSRNVRIKIEGQILNFKIENLAKFTKFQKHLLSSGVVLVEHVRNSDWLLLVRDLLGKAPELRQTVADTTHAWTGTVAEWIERQQSSPETYLNFIASRDIYKLALQGNAEDFKRPESMAIASIMRSLGWTHSHGRSEGVLHNGWRPPAGTDARKWARML